ncbi:MAG TPA: hypothetical protein VGK36_08875 [Candidatus Angelobacter sp.]|jgi:hypothetical protein
MNTPIAFVTHWQELLHNYLLRRQNEAFAWGSMDCCLFACDAIHELTGVDLAADFRGSDFRGKYNSALSAARAMKSFVGQGTQARNLVEDVAVKIAAQNGIQEVPVLMAQRGDVLLLDSPLGKSLGILGLRGTHVHTTGPDGVVDVPLHECERAWRIPKFAPVPAEATLRRK